MLSTMPLSPHSRPGPPEAERGVDHARSLEMKKP
jgi:hypothetical protein